MKERQRDRERKRSSSQDNTTNTIHDLLTTARLCSTRFNPPPRSKNTPLFASDSQKNYPIPLYSIADLRAPCFDFHLDPCKRGMGEGGGETNTVPNQLFSYICLLHRLHVMHALLPTPPPPQPPPSVFLYLRTRVYIESFIFKMYTGYISGTSSRLLPTCTNEQNLSEGNNKYHCRIVQHCTRARNDHESSRRHMVNLRQPS